MLVLGLETSCDETAAAVVAGGSTVLSSVVASQAEIHAKYGGVVPEIASRRHVEAVVPVVAEALARAGVEYSDLGLIAVTNGPGLIGSLIIGVSLAKSLAFALGLPLVAVDHLIAHVYASFVDGPPPAFPFLALVVSGGHTDLLLFEGHCRYRLIGQTRDDAAGEAFDKVARLLGLGYPGGPAIDRLAQDGDPAAWSWPDPRLRDEEGRFDFSFSGLKTAVLYHLRRRALAQAATGAALADLAASFQARVVQSLTAAALEAASELGVSRIVLAGGVAANSVLRRALREQAGAAGVEVFIPAADLCTDNAAMVAAAGFHRHAMGARDGLDLTASSSAGAGGAFAGR